MFKNLSLLVCVFVFSTAIFGQRMTKDAKPCDEIKGKTFIGWSIGKFDALPDPGSAMRVVFDANGKGTARMFFIGDTVSKQLSADHFVVDVSCAIYQSPSKKAVSYLQFTHKNGVDAGKAAITSYDKGAKIWAEAAALGRPMKGWMFQVPANPPVSDNLVDDTGKIK